MNVLFTSDLHLGHVLAAEKRGFNSVEEHDEFVINSLNKVCNKRTILWVLGDVAFTPEDLDKMKQVNGKKRLILGNHDKEPISHYLEIFEHVHGFLKYKDMWLSHCPIHPQEMYRVKANLHGHIHKGAATSELEFPYINLNFDFWSRPVPLDEIRDYIKTLKD